MGLARNGAQGEPATKPPSNIGHEARLVTPESSGREERLPFTIAIDAIGLKGKASEVRVKSLADVRAFFSLLSEGDPDGRPRIEARVLQDGRQLFRVTRNGVFVYRFEYAPDA